MFPLVASAVWLCLFSSASGFFQDPEEKMTVPQIIEYYGYPSEVHTVETQDGYLIDVHRIPHGRDTRPIVGCDAKRPAIVLYHSLVCSSAQYVFNTASKSLGFILADAGFDVWLGNVRGNQYGRRHKTLHVSSMHFWNFTWYDHAHDDVTSTVDYILNVTQQPSLFSLGHSQGGSILLARVAEADPAWQAKIRTFYALAPASGFSHTVMPSRLADTPTMQHIAQALFDGKFGVYPIGLPSIVSNLLMKVCGTSFSSNVCGLVEQAASFSREKSGQLNTTRLPVYLAHIPSTTSTLNLLHWAQVYKYHELRKLDLGEKRNLVLYGTPEAPALNLTAIVAPTVLYFSADDHIVDAADVKEHMITKMGSALRKTVDLDHFSHMDASIGLRANDEVYQPIIQDMYEVIAKEGC